MGTRGLLGHIIRGQKKGMYNHFDSYPVGLGVDLVKFIKSLTPEQVEKMKERLESVEWQVPTSASNCDIYAANPTARVKKGHAPSNEAQVSQVEASSANVNVDGQRSSEWQAHGTVCLYRIFDGYLKQVVDSTEFENDTLFCEWTYFVDWEKQELHVRGNDGELDEVCAFAELSEEWMRRLQSRANG